jgi:DNA-binding GntR family transcriptional regulator
MKYITEFTRKKGYTPSLTHIMNFYGIDHNAANRAVTKLVERGDLERTERRGVFTIATRDHSGRPA